MNENDKPKRNYWEEFKEAVRENKGKVKTGAILFLLGAIFGISVTNKQIVMIIDSLSDKIPPALDDIDAIEAALRGCSKEEIMEIMDEVIKSGDMHE